MFHCRKCGRPNEDHYRFCLGCGASLAEQKELESTKGHKPLERPAPKPAAAPRRPAAKPAPTHDAGLPAARLCTQCGSPVSAVDVFCGKCGLRLGGSAPGAGAVNSAELILIRTDGSEGSRFPLEGGKNVVGRTDPAFEGDPFVSPRHAAFVLDGEGLTVEDLGSLNGVFVRIAAPIALRHGAQVRVGLELLEYEATDQAAPFVTAEGDTEVWGSPDPGAWGRLKRVAAPSVASHAWLLTDTDVTLGRDHGQITFGGDAFVSGTHARITKGDDGVTLEDLGSSNGTYVRISAPWKLADGDVLLLGQQIVRVSRSGEPR